MKTTTIVLASLRQAPPLDPILRAGEIAVYRGQPSAAFRPSRLKIFGSSEARVRPLMLEWGGVRVDLSRDPQPLEPDLAHAKGVRLYTESSAELTLRNEGGDAEVFPVFYGRGGLGERDEFCSSEMFFAVEKTRGTPSPVEIEPGGYERFAARFHFPTRIVRARVRSSAPLGQVRVVSMNIAGISLVLGEDLPIEALEGVSLDSIPLDGTRDVSIALRSSASEGAAHAAVSVELDILARGEWSEDAFRDALEKSKHEHEAFMKNAAAAPSREAVEEAVQEDTESDTALLEGLSTYISPGMVLLSVERGMVPPDLAHALLRRFSHAWEKKTPAAPKEA